MARPQRPWVRFYVEAIHDPKLRRLSPAQRWLWVAVLAMARQSPVPGHLLITAADDEVEPLSEADLVDAAAVKRSDVRAGLAAFRRSGMLTFDPELGCDVVAKWGERQFESDEVAQRTRRHRSQRNGTDPPGTTLERSYDVPGNSNEAFSGTPPETEADTDIQSHPQTTSSCGEADKPDDDESKPLGRQELAEAACDLLGDMSHQAQLDAGRVRSSTGGHRRSCRASARTDYLEQAQFWAQEWPSATPDQIAQEVLSQASQRSSTGQRPDGEVDMRAIYEGDEARRQERAADAPAELDVDRGLAHVAEMKAAREAARAALTKDPDHAA